MNKGGKKQTHIVLRFLTTYAFLAAALIIVFSSFFYIFFLRISFQQIRFDAQETAILAANEVNGDLIEQFTEPTHEELPEYQQMIQKLLRYHQYSNSVESVYILRPTEQSPTHWEFVVDGMLPEDSNDDGMIDESETPAHLGEIYDSSCCPDLVIGLTGPAADRVITHDKWGHWISGYAPIYNSHGEAVGVVGVDISVERFYEQRSVILSLLFGTIAVAIALSILFGFWGYIIFRSESLAINRALEIRASDLERRVKEKTHAMRQFTAMLVHDLRAPLTVMKWTIQLLRENNVNKNERDEMYRDLAAETESLVKRVNEMLDVSKIDAGKFSVKTKKGDLGMIVQNVVNDFHVLAKKRGLELSAFLQENLPKADLDAEKITQVLQNLISNAIKYTETGSIHVAVLHEKSSKALRVEIKDTGIGIGAAEQKNLFIPFSSAPQGHTQDEPELVSTGLGLAIVKGIIDAHAGKVGVISKKGKGSTFWFEIPTV